MASYFDVDLEQENHLRGIVEDAVCMPVPEGWRDDEAEGEFVEIATGNRSSNHPLDAYFVECIRRARERQARLDAGGHGRARRPSDNAAERAEAVAWMVAAGREGTAPRAVLGVDVHATKAECRRRFRALSLLVHPDKNPALPEAAEAFKVLVGAFKRA